MTMMPSGWSTHPWVTDGQDRVRFGIHLGPWPDCEVTIEWAQLVEELGFDSFWLRDHPGRAPEDTWTYLGAIATTTKRIRLGTLVNCVLYRSPTSLARCAADVDRLSHGRLVLGVGAGWDETEFKQLGVPFPSVANRLAALEETIQIVNGLWEEAPFTYVGRHFQVQEGHIQRGPIQTPRIPWLVGGGGEKVTLRLVAQYADMSNIDAFSLPREEDGLASVERKSAALARHCSERGRDLASVVRSYHAVTTMAPSAAAVQQKIDHDAWPPHISRFPVTLAGTPDNVIGQCRSLVNAGINYFIFVVRDEETLRLLRRDVLPAFG